MALLLNKEHLNDDVILWDHNLLTLGFYVFWGKSLYPWILKLRVLYFRHLDIGVYTKNERETFSLFN